MPLCVYKCKGTNGWKNSVSLYKIIVVYAQDYFENSEVDLKSVIFHEF